MNGISEQAERELERLDDSRLRMQNAIDERGLNARVEAVGNHSVGFGLRMAEGKIRVHRKDDPWTRWRGWRVGYQADGDAPAVTLALVDTLDEAIDAAIDAELAPTRDPYIAVQPEDGAIVGLGNGPDGAAGDAEYETGVPGDSFEIFPATRTLAATIAVKGGLITWDALGDGTACTPIEEECARAAGRKDQQRRTG